MDGHRAFRDPGDTVAGMEAAEQKPLTVLVVDDNPDDLILFGRAVRALGWRVTTAETGRAGLDRVQAERFDVVLLDYNLGDMTGTEVLLRVKEAGITTPVLIQSGLGSEFIVARALALGAEGFVAKEAPDYAQQVIAKLLAAAERARAAGLGSARPGRRESVQEVENVLDDLLERSGTHVTAVGFVSPDGFRVSTRFKTPKTLSPETICAMVASATSTCHFLGEGLNLPRLQIVSAEFEDGRFYAAPVATYGVLFAAVGSDQAAPASTQKDIQFAAKELAALLATMNHAQHASPS